MTYLSYEEKVKVLSKVDTSVKQEQALLVQVYRIDYDNILPRAWEIAKSKVKLSTQYTEYSLHEEIKSQFSSALAKLSASLDLCDWVRLSVAFEWMVDSTHTYPTEGDWRS